MGAGDIPRAANGDTHEEGGENHPETGDDDEDQDGVKNDLICSEREET